MIIKFRAWLKESKEMKIVSELNMWNLGHVYTVDEDGVHDITKGSNEYILLQYTGLKDKNGVEIYDGDILETDKGYIQKVEHITETIDGTTYVSGFYAWDEEKHTWMAIDNTDKIIGNIYENADVLEVEQ